MTPASASSLFLNNEAKRQPELFITEYWQSLIPAVFKAVSEQMCWLHHKNPERMMKAILPFASLVFGVCGVTKLLLNSKRESSHQRCFFTYSTFLNYFFSLLSPL